MTISYLGKVGAQMMLKEDLTSALFGNPELASASEMITYVADVRDWSKKSKTAQAIFAVIDRSDRDIYIVGMKRGGFSCFSSSAPNAENFQKFYGVPAKTELRPSISAQKGAADETNGMITRSGVVFFDIEAKFSFKERSGLDAQRNITYKNEENELNPYVAFLHELGHAKQFIENPLFFEGSLLNTATLAKSLEDELVKRKTSQLTPKVPDASQPPANVTAAVGAGPGGPPPPAPGLMPTTKGQSPRIQALEHVNKTYKLGTKYSDGVYRDESGATKVAINIPKKASRPGWAVRIEADNMVSHEWPVCDELGEPKRMTYSEISLL